MAVTPNTLSTSEYWMSPDALSIELNAMDNPQYLQVSLLAGSVIIAYKQDVIAYDSSLNYQKWNLQAYNNFFDRTDRAYVYAQLEKKGNTALIVYSYDILELTETITNDTGESREVYNVYLGTISSSVNSNGESIPRMWETTFETGSLNTDKNRQEDQLGEWSKMFRLNKVTDMIEVLKDITSATIHKLYIGVRKIFISDVQTSSEGDKSLEASDNIIPTTKFLKESTESKFHRKDKTDVNPFLQKFLKGIEIGNFISGLLGTGGSITIDDDGNSHAEFDYLTIRKVALFIELIIQEAKAVGGMLVVSPSGMTVSKVEETSTSYRCYFERTDGDRTLKNQFTVGTQARRQTFNLTGQAYYWRLVTAVGEDYVDLSKTDCDTGSTIPQAGDELVGLGHRTDKTRQAAIIISAFGDDSPSIKYYQGIDSFSLVDKEVKMDYYDNTNGRFKSITYGDTYVGERDKSSYFDFKNGQGLDVNGRFKVQPGSTGAGNFSDLPDEIAKAVDIGGENLLLNTGFTGDYDVQKLSSSTKLNQKTKLYSPSLQGWTGSAEIVEEAASGSGYACKLGNISQPVLLIPGEKYVFGFWAKGNSVEISCGGQTYKQAVTSSYQFYVVRFTYQSGGVFMLSGDATVYNLKLERGTIATDWCPSSKDAPAIADRFKYLWYIQDAIKGNTSIIGGLILSTMLQLGKYTDGVMEKVNAGISGIYNDDQDVAFWAGGTFEQAIATVQKILSGEVPADEEWSTLAKFVATHGGDIFLRGYIYALGGVFRGTIYAKDGEFNGKVSIGNGNILLNKDGSGQLAGGNIKWDKNNFLQINSIISSPFVSLFGVLNEESKRWIFSIGKFMNSFKNNFWLNMDEIYGTEYSAYIEFPYKKEWEGSSVMFFNRGFLQSLKTTGTDWDEKELLPGKLYRFVLINTDDLTKWYCQEL